MCGQVSFIVTLSLEHLEMKENLRWHLREVQEIFCLYGRERTFPLLELGMRKKRMDEREDGNCVNEECLEGPFVSVRGVVAMNCSKF